MNIQAKLSWTYNILLIIGIITISAYAILTIRSFLFKDGIHHFENDAKVISLAIEDFDQNDEFLKYVSDLAGLYDYNIAIFDSSGSIIFNSVSSAQMENSREMPNEDIFELLESEPGVPYLINEQDYDKLVAFNKLNHKQGEVFYLRISQYKSEYYAAVSSIRHIIYAGMAFSITAVLIVSFIFSRYMRRPIMQLNNAALDIAEGNLEGELVINRNDEFGTLADSLNKMASKLKSDNEKLKNLNEKQNQFFADIAHEVRNPLHTISGAIEMLQLPNLDEEKKAQYMVTARKQIERVVRLFQDIKSLQRYDYDESYIIKSVFDVSEVVSEVVTTYKPIASEKGINLILRAKQNRLVEADRDKIEQVMDNLISNAIKYTNDGEIHVSCVQKKNLIEISVQDTGIGIAEEHLERLFDRFYRTDKARSRDKGGTGLGLAVVKGILSAHDRDIQVESTPGVGTRFYFSLEIVGD